MKSIDLDAYWVPAVRALIGNYKNEAMTNDGWPSYLELDELLGIVEYRKFINRHSSWDYPMSEELKQLLTQLAGPHGKTILKAYRIKKGLIKT